MYYVFSNEKELDTILKEEKYEELLKKFSKTKLRKKRKLGKKQMSAKDKYQYICESILVYLDENQKNAFWHKAIDIFTVAWDIETLQMIKLNPQLYGVLTEKARDVIAEYENYERIAKATVIPLIFDECKEKVVPIGYDGKFIKVRYVSGKLSFVRNGIEYEVLGEI